MLFQYGDYSGYNWKKIDIGESHALGISRSGYLYGWGNDLDGALGRGVSGESYNYVKNPGLVGGSAISCNWIDIAAGDGASFGVKKNGTLWGWGLDSCTQSTSPCQIGDSADWEKVFAAGGSAMAINSDGRLFSWGENSYGGLGVGDCTDRTAPYPCSDTSSWETVSLSPDDNGHTLGIKEDGTLWAWGSNVYGELGIGSRGGISGGIFEKVIPTKISDDCWVCVSAGAIASFGVKADGTLWACGWNYHEQLGIGNSDIWLYQTTMKQIERNDWCWVSADKDYTVWAMTTSGDLYAWGNSDNIPGYSSDQTSPVKIGSMIVE